MKVRSAAAVAAIAFLSACSIIDNEQTSNSETSGPPTTAAEIADIQPCPTFEPSKNVGVVKDRELNELSGLSKSAGNPDIFWTHNDSGDSARVFAVHQDGKVAATYNLKDVSAFDFEDIAVSPVEPHDVWVADTGDNFHFRNTVQLYSFPEPRVTAGAFSDVETKRLNVKFAQPDGKGTTSVDVESFFLDKGGNGYLIEKTKDARSAWVFRIAAVDMTTSSTVTAQPIAQIQGNSTGIGVGPTAAALSDDGTMLVVKNYSETFLWKFSETSSIPAVLKARPAAPCPLKTGAGEAITFDGASLLTVEEGVGKPLRFTRAK